MDKGYVSRLEALRERLLQGDPATLSDAAILALILRTGDDTQDALALGDALLAYFGDLAGLAGASSASLSHYLARPVQVASLLAALELAKRLPQGSARLRPLIQTSEDVATLLGPQMAHLKQEHLRTLLLDTHRRVVASPTVYIGSLHMTVVRIAEVFREAMAHNCASLILVHNHPSGDPTPSPEDLELTEQIIAAGRLLDIAVLDHVIIGQGTWRSLRDTGVIF
ncbi:MAG: RadC family protein [Anaerolineales bacterium]